MAVHQAVLALDSVPANEANPIDALGYLDEATAEDHKMADTLIREEQKQMERHSDIKLRHYLTRIPQVPPASFQGHPLLQAEVKRVKEQKEMPGVDRTRFALAAPMAQNDLRAWGSAVKNAKAQLEHQSTRLTNLELFARYGPGSWRMHNAALGSIVKRLRQDKQALEQERDTVNKRRKLSQEPLGSKLQEKEAAYIELLGKTKEIAGACQKMEAEIEALASAAAQAQPSSSSSGVAKNSLAKGLIASNTS